MNNSNFISNCRNSQSCHWYSGGHIPCGLCHRDFRVSNTTLSCQMSETTHPTAMEKEEWASTAFHVVGGGGEGTLCSLFCCFQSNFSLSRYCNTA